MDLVRSKRIAGWEGRLNAHVAKHFNLAFRWGKTDCAMFCAGVVQALTGEDIAYGLRGYRSEKEGLRKVNAKGFKDHEDVFAKQFPLVDRGVGGCLMPILGDLLVIQQGERFAMGVFGGVGVRAMTPSGLAEIPFSMAVRGYAI